MFEFCNGCGCWLYETEKVKCNRCGQSGFAMMELLIVVALLAILAAVAAPKFIDFTTSAKDAALSGVVGALASASSLNANGRMMPTPVGVVVANCTDVASALQSGLPVGYTITSAPLAPNTTAECTVTDSYGKTAVFAGIGTN